MQQSSALSELNFVEGKITRLDLSENSELVYEVQLEKAVVGRKEFEGRLVGPIICRLAEGSRAALPEPPAGAKLGDKHIWLVGKDVRGEVWIRDPLSSNDQVRDSLLRLSIGIDAAQNGELEQSREVFLSLLKSHSPRYYYSTAKSIAISENRDGITVAEIRHILAHVFAAYRSMPLREGKSELALLANDDSLPLDVRLLAIHQWVAMIPKETRLEKMALLDLFLSLLSEGKTASQGEGCGELFRLLLSKKELMGDDLARMSEAIKSGLSFERPAEFRQTFVKGVYAWDLPPPSLSRNSPVTNAFLQFLLDQLTREKDETVESILLNKLAISTLNQEQLAMIETSTSTMSPRAQAQIAKEIDLVRNPPKPKKRS